MQDPKETPAQYLNTYQLLQYLQQRLRNDLLPPEETNVEYQAALRDTLAAVRSLERYY